MKYWSRITALSLAALFMLAGCGKKEPDFTQEEELPYGATMRSDKTSYAVPMTYDRRFLDDTQVAAVADILCAVQNQDADMYLNCTPDFYAAYQLEVYGAADYTALLGSLHTTVAESTGEDFTFNMVLINEISTNQNAGNLAEAMILLDNLDEEGSFTSGIQNAWDLTVEWDLSYHNGESYTVINERHIYLFQTAEKCFCLM